MGRRWAVAGPKCGVCGAEMKRSGATSAGAQRWRCASCGSSAVRKSDTASRALRAFAGWPLGKLARSDPGIPARTFREKTARFWRTWPILPACDEIRHVVHVDGIRLSRRCVVLIACTDEHVVGCHLARTENSRDRSCPMARIAPPDVLVCDGGGGIEKARRATWPSARVQRCAFHAFCQVRRCTTTHPKTQAGIDLYAIAKGLLKISSQREALDWLARFNGRRGGYEGFLRERGEDGGRFERERLRKARKALVSLCSAGTLFAHLDDGLLAGGGVPATSNRIENLDGQIRRMLSAHRGMSIDHRIKAVFWFCYMKSEAPMGFGRMLVEFPDDDQVREWRRQAAKASGDNSGAPARWGEGVAWAEFHNSIPYPNSID